MKELRKIRKARGLSQNALASLAGVAASKLSAYENDNGAPSAATLGKLADALGCSIDALLGRPMPQLAAWSTSELLAELDRRAA